jgi:adenine-specific DNA-methyltransferase
MSIGQAELANAVAILDQIFGEENRISICTRMMKSGGQKGKFFSPNTDYVLVYAKWLEALSVFRGEISQELQDKVYNQIETDGNRKGERYRGMGLFQPTLDARPNQRYYIQCPDGSFVIPPGNTFPTVVKDGSKVLPEHGDGVWRWTPDRYFEERKKGNLLFKKTSTSPLLDERQQQSKWNIYTKIWLKERLEGGSLPLDIFDKFENRHSSKEIAELEIPFNFAKPTQLLSYLMQIIGIAEEDIVLDFFAGSCSTAHALFNYRIQSQGRIRCAATKIKEENPEYEGDLGFKVFKLDSSNIRAWNPDRSDLEQTLIDHMEHLVEGRSEEDVLYELLLKRGVDLTVPIEEKAITGKTVYSIGYGALFACLDTAISRKEVEDLAQGIIDWHKELKPADDTQVVFRDSAFANDIAKTNMTAILEQHGIAHVRSL